MFTHQEEPVTIAEAVGLSSEHARELLVQKGPNRIAAPRPVPWWRRLLAQVRDPLIIVLLIATALTLATGDTPDAIIIAVVIVVNTAVGFAQEVKADNAIAALRELTAPQARAMRDGIATEVDAETLVPGDVILVGEGDIVPADATLVEAAGLLIDESALTGESVPVEKDLSSTPTGSISSGTVVVHGRGTAVVTRTGGDSAMGAIAAGLTAASTLTPLQRRLAGLGRLLAGVAAALCVVVMAVGLVRGEPTELMIVTAISLVVAAVPESLPAVITLALALGARRMAARHALVRRLPAVETLGSVTVLATDKTGTITEGQMVAELLWTPQGAAAVSGAGYSPAGSIHDQCGTLDADSRPDLATLLTACALCNDAGIGPPRGPDDNWHAVGEPTEAALVAVAAKLPLDIDAVRAEYPRLREAPFDSDRKRMTTIHQTPGGGALIACKGAPERMLHSDLLGEPAAVIESARARVDELAAEGYRVLAVATATSDALSVHPLEAEHRLRLAGLVALADPPRPAAAETIQACRRAGILPVLITGDHPQTARAIARRVGILDAAGRVLSGTDLGATAPDPSVANVFARTTPTQKLELVQAWQHDGHVVAMTGDGVNDAPALRNASIGVAMGGRGTDIARQAADLVLVDDDLGTVVAAVEEGRRVYANVRRFLLYALAGGTAEILVMLFGPAVGLALPLLPGQILWINLLTHGLPGVAMGAEPVEPGTMSRPPRPPAESVVGAGLWPRVLTLGALVAVTTLGIGIWGSADGRPWQSMVFLALASMQFGIALGVRARPGTWTNPFLLTSIAAVFVLQLAALYLPLLQDLLHTEPLSGLQAAAGVAVSVLGYAAARYVRRSASVGERIVEGER